MKSAFVPAVLLLAVLGGTAWLVFGDPAESDPGGAQEADASEHQGVEAGHLLDQEGGSSSALDLQRGPAGAAASDLPAIHGLEGVASFFGTVVDAQGQALEGVSIEALGSSGWAGSWSRTPSTLAVTWHAVTDGNGRFQLPPVPRDRLHFLITFQHPGLAPMQLEDLPATLGRGRDLGRIIMGSGTRMEGTVYSPRGLPMAGAEVVPFLDSALDTFTGQGGTPVAGTPKVQTDAQGRFVLENMPASRMRLKASTASFLDGWSTTLHGGHGVVVTGIRLELRAGREVAGRVIDDLQRPVPGAQVEAKTSVQGPMGMRSEAQVTTAGEDGRFLLRLPEESGRLLLKVHALGYWEEGVAFPSEQLSEGLQVQMRPMEPLQGMVVEESGRPVAGVEVRLLTAHPFVTDPATGISHATATTDEMGNFRLMPDLAQAGKGPFQVCAWKEGWAPACSEGFPLGDGHQFSDPNLRLVLWKGAQVSGSVAFSSGKPAAKAVVFLRALRPVTASAGMFDPPAEGSREGDHFSRTVSTSEGAFSFHGVPPGDYRLEAVLEGASPAQSEDFQLTEEGYSTSMVLPAASAIEGRVLGGLQGFQGLHVLARSAGKDALEAPVDLDGRFLFREIMPGIWDLELHEAQAESTSMSALWGAPMHLVQQPGVDVTPGETVQVEMSLTGLERATVTGSVLVHGVPASNHAVYLVPRSPSGVEEGMGLFGNGSQGGRQLVATTDHRGEYRFAAVEVGEYWLVVCRQGGFPSFPLGLGDDGPTGLARRSVVLEPDGETRQDFDLLVGGIHCAGDQVHRRGAVPVQLIPVPMDGRRSHRFLLRRQGHLIEELAAGNYRLEVGEDALFGSQLVTVPSDAIAQVQVAVAVNSGVGGEKGVGFSEEAENQRFPR